uniref:Uncharacterized protein n=1 Tax=Romanomermis culicivorax TaxID=13658 RepID=A0A915JMF9_ROMCU
MVKMINCVWATCSVSPD